MIPEKVADRQPAWSEYLAGSRQSNTLRPVAVQQISAPTLSMPTTLDGLVDGGYLPMLRPCAPPGVPCTFSHSSKGLVEKISDGKVPAKFVQGAWRGFKGWGDYAPTLDDVAEWRRWPDASLCIVTGEVGAFDLDIKISPEDTSDSAVRARGLVATIKSTIANSIGKPIGELPLRWRDNSSSCLVFVRLNEAISKRKVILVDPVDGTAHAVEFMAVGQQVVVAGRHKSGAMQYSSLPPFADLAEIDASLLDAIFQEIESAVVANGYKVASSSKSERPEKSAPPYSPEVAIRREVLARYKDWLADVLPLPAGAQLGWRITSDDLGRELEEDLEIYPDGIFDHGSERTHDPISLICEFGAIDDAGEIGFGGAPEYGLRGEIPFAVVGEADTTIRRPKPSEALRWLCGRLASREFSEFGEHARWWNSLETIASALGLSLQSLTVAHLHRTGLLQNDEGREQIAPDAWTAEELLRTYNLDFLAALQVVDPAAFDAVAFARDWASNGSIDLRVIVTDRRAAVAAGLAALESDNSAADDVPEPFDIFAQDDPADLSTLPANCLPEMLGRWVRTESRRKGTPESFAAIAAITVASAAIGSSRKIQVRKFDTGFVQPAALWSAIVAPPGSAKSPILRAAERPLRDLDTEWYSIWKALHDSWSAAAQAYKNKRKDAPEPGPEPYPRRCAVDDVTLEKQVHLHAHNPRGLLRSPDELMGLFGSLGAYKRNGDGDRSQVLRLFDGNAIVVDLRKRPNSTR
ncbi:DUF3987 domain-containing protein [Aminobacter niigataensis]|uniref:DUF3987 domain-containing protein n=1 Tax=Aminobacter niigataensis TaxID=83265 RepID=UPI0024C8B564|nr:DUF3987 domain-containing protein [Aminobacter niigataensis]CAI2931885.1 protein of unknown function [Aminobacter niigataensis]